ncbi:hypothetical protein NQ997_18795 [Acinetobacter baumannii]|nr:hypothetical protein [Acinetobacter baumannii]MDC4896081.1 hypothetical protein [Acinetobacter baumannii]MDC4901858.1 hypothetical protein [Acinetobacter baumannii]MDC4909071.1 hypothetical protein [Acinetobacter baumannii]MDC4914107.1 hypothetical protein [Acinetobacter baumannii]
MEFTSQEGIEYFNYLLNEREVFKNEHGVYPSYLVLTDLNKQKLLIGMDRMGVPPKANPESTTYYFYGAEMVIGDNEGFYINL